MALNPTPRRNGLTMATLRTDHHLSREDVQRIVAADLSMGMDLSTKAKTEESIRGFLYAYGRAGVDTAYDQIADHDRSPAAWLADADHHLTTVLDWSAA